MDKDFCYAIKQGSLEIRRACDDANVFFELEGFLMFMNGHSTRFI